MHWISLHRVDCRRCGWSMGGVVFWGIPDPHTVLFSWILYVISSLALGTKICIVPNRHKQTNIGKVQLQCWERRSSIFLCIVIDVFSLLWMLLKHTHCCHPVLYYYFSTSVPFFTLFSLSIFLAYCNHSYIQMFSSCKTCLCVFFFLIPFLKDSAFCPSLSLLFVLLYSHPHFFWSSPLSVLGLLSYLLFCFIKFSSSAFVTASFTVQ